MVNECVIRTLGYTMKRVVNSKKDIYNILGKHNEEKISPQEVSTKASKNGESDFYIFFASGY